MSSLNKIHLPSALVLAICVCGNSILLGMAAVLAGGGLYFQILDPDAGQVTFTAISFAWDNVLVILLVLPAVFFSLYRLLNKPLHIPSFPRWINANTALIIWPAVLGAGFLLTNLAGLTWLFVPPLQILAIGIPIWWLVSFAGRNMDASPVSTRWKLFSIVLLAGNPLIFLVELLGVAALAGLWITLQPEIVTSIESLTRDIQYSGLNPESVDQAVKAIFAQPGLVAALIVGASILAPLVEEVLKTAGVWLLFNKNLTPSRGLLAGVVCGAGFALVESLGVINQPFEGSAWLAIIIGRLGTAIMHIFTAGLTGWGIASLASGRNFGGAVLGYAAAVVSHGLWNFFVITTAIHPFLDFSLPHNRWLEPMGSTGIILPAALALFYLGGLFLANRRLRPAFNQTPVIEVK
jgi:RsiW-degrading membrane proteinase PrsW (M82 family)